MTWQCLTDSLAGDWLWCQPGPRVMRCVCSATIFKSKEYLKRNNKYNISHSANKQWIRWHEESSKYLTLMFFFVNWLWNSSHFAMRQIVIYKILYGKKILAQTFQQWSGNSLFYCTFSVSQAQELLKSLWWGLCFFMSILWSLEIPTANRSQS